MTDKLRWMIRDIVKDLKKSASDISVLIEKIDNKLIEQKDDIVFDEIAKALVIMEVIKEDLDTVATAFEDTQ